MNKKYNSSFIMQKQLQQITTTALQLQQSIQCVFKHTRQTDTDNDTAADNTITTTTPSPSPPPPPPPPAHHHHHHCDFRLLFN